STATVVPAVESTPLLPSSPDAEPEATLVLPSGPAVGSGAVVLPVVPAVPLPVVPAVPDPEESGTISDGASVHAGSPTPRSTALIIEGHCIGEGLHRGLAPLPRGRGRSRGSVSRASPAAAAPRETARAR